MAQRDVTVSFNSGQKTISANPDTVKPKVNDDTVEWSGPQQYTIHLQGRDITATQSGSQWVASAGPWNTKQTLKYDISAPGYTTLDPQIDVQP